MNGSVERLAGGREVPKSFHSKNMKFCKISLIREGDLEWGGSHGGDRDCPPSSPFV